MKKIINNKYLNAFAMLLLYAAIFYFLVLVLRCFMEQSIYPLNFFSILSLDVVFPSAFQNTLPDNIVSLIVVVIIYILIFKKQRIFIEKK